MDESVNDAADDNGAKAMIAEQLEHGITLLDRMQQQGHFVTNDRDVRAWLFQLRERLRAEMPARQRGPSAAHADAGISYQDKHA